VVPTTNDESIVHEISKSKFLEVNKTLLNNVNRGGHRVIKYAKVWVVNAFNKWCKFKSFDIEKIYCRYVQRWKFYYGVCKYVVCSFFKLQKRMKACTLPPSKFFDPFLCIYKLCLCFFCFKHQLSLIHYFFYSIHNFLFFWIWISWTTIIFYYFGLSFTPFWFLILWI
jgi:hypothetical protein